MQTTLVKNPHCEAVVSGTIPTADVDAHLKNAIDRAVSSVELPGFRRGKVPKERVIEEVGLRSLWLDAAEDALKDELGNILKEHKLAPILPPAIGLTPSEPQSDVPFTITVICAPTVELKDYQETAKKALAELAKGAPDRAAEVPKARAALNQQIKGMIGKDPETDDDAKKVGFENVAALNFFLDQEAGRAVDAHEEQRTRSGVAEALLKSATYDLPAVMIEDEARGMLEATKGNVAEQMPWNEYLEKRGVTEDVVLNEMKPVAEKRTALDLIFSKIAHEESLKPDEAETHRVAHALMHQGTPDAQAHAYAAEVSIREKIWALLGVAAKVSATDTPPEEKAPQAE